jgi:hypothetical protein
MYALCIRSDFNPDQIKPLETALKTALKHVEALKKESDIQEPLLRY